MRSVGDHELTQGDIAGNAGTLLWRLITIVLPVMAFAAATDGGDAGPPPCCRISLRCSYPNADSLLSQRRSNSHRFVGTPTVHMQMVAF